MNSVEQQDAQRIALVATLATQLYAVAMTALSGTETGKWPDGVTDEAAMRGCVSDARKILRFAMEIERAKPTGDA